MSDAQGRVIPDFGAAAGTASVRHSGGTAKKLPDGYVRCLDPGCLLCQRLPDGEHADVVPYVEGPDQQVYRDDEREPSAAPPRPGAILDKSLVDPAMNNGAGVDWTGRGDPDMPHYMAPSKTPKELAALVTESPRALRKEKKAIAEALIDEGHHNARIFGKSERARSSAVERPTQPPASAHSRGQGEEAGSIPTESTNTTRPTCEAPGSERTPGGAEAETANEALARTIREGPPKKGKKP